MLTFVLLFYYLIYEIMFWYDMMSELDLLSMKHELAWWCDIDLVIAWLWVQTLENQTKNFIFSIFGFELNMKGWEKP